MNRGLRRGWVGLVPRLAAVLDERQEDTVDDLAWSAASLIGFRVVQGVGGGLMLPLVRGFGLGAVTIPLMTAAFIGLERSDVPNASIITRIAQQVGGSFGVAVLAVILSLILPGKPKVQSTAAEPATTRQPART